MPTPLARAALTAPPRVEDRDSHAVGTLHDYLVDPATGQARFAVVALSGFMGLGKSFYPVPFALLQFDAVRAVYVLGIGRKQLEGGPSWANSPPEFDDGYAGRVSSYYGGQA